MASTEGLGGEGPQYGRVDPILQRQLMLTAIDGERASILMMLSKFEAPDTLVWMLLGDGERATDRDIARVLALFALDDEVQLMPPLRMPDRAPIAILFDDGTLRHSRRRTFPAWALEEIARAGDALLATQGDYVRAVRDVLRRRDVPGFTRLPSNFMLQDPEGMSRLAPNVPDIVVDVSRNPATHGARWDQIVRTDYARDRYMAHLSRDALGQRMTDCVNNLHVVNDRNQVSLEADDMLTHYWFARLAEIMAEMQLRYGPYPAGYDQLVANSERVGSLNESKWRFHGPLVPPAGLSRPFIVKYGERCFMQPMLEHGRVHVSPASRYAEASLNPAMRDDELTADLDVDDFGLPAFAGQPGPVAARTWRRHTVRVLLQTNYYVYCTSRRFATRLAHDFDADCCLVIHDPDAFAARLTRAVSDQLPGWTPRIARVEYFDPMWVNVREVEVLTWKHFRYAYQQEERLAWLPPEPKQDLVAIDVEVGPLTDIATLVVPSR